MLFIILAAICFIIGALIAFTPLSGISVIGLVCLGLFFLALSGAWGGPAMPWRR